MKHLTHEELWALAASPGETTSHLDQCVKCLEALDEVKAAQSVLRALPEPEPMPAAMAYRVESNLAQAFAAQQAKRWASWWPSMPRLALALGAVVLLAGGAWFLAQQTRVADQPTVAVLPSAGEAGGQPSVPVPVPAPVVAKKLTATVASAKRARTSTSTSLAKAQVLEEGSALTTEKGGALWLRLPDGSRAGLTGASEMQLAKLEAKTLTLDLNKGSVSLVVPHREDRVLTVRAGELEVKDLGTQFLVSRELGRIVVAVEEGSVEVKVPGHTRTVSAGHAVAYQQGELDELAPLAPIVPASPVSSAAAAAPSTNTEKAAPPTPAVAPPPQTEVPEVVDAPDESPPPPEIDPAAEWAAAPPTARGSQMVAPQQQTQTPMQPQGQKVVVVPSPGLSMAGIERRLDELRRQLQSPFVQLTMRQQQAREIGRLADAGSCKAVLDLSDIWLRYAHAPPDEAPLRREVLFQKMRCLRRLGRLPEADQLRREIEAAPE